MVRRHERGINMPIELYRKKYCGLFGATEQDLGFRAAQTNAIQARPQWAARKSIPVEFADAAYLAKAHEHIREIVDLDNRFGGADLVRLSTRFLRSCMNNLARAPMTLSSNVTSRRRRANWQR
jgi:hypothetical protein